MYYSSTNTTVGTYMPRDLPRAGSPDELVGHIGFFFTERTSCRGRRCCQPCLAGFVALASLICKRPRQRLSHHELHRGFLFVILVLAGALQQGHAKRWERYLEPGMIGY